jgi:hypothetical protein
MKKKLSRLHPKRVYNKSGAPCHYVSVRHLIDRHHILAVLIDELHYVKNLEGEASKLTRAKVTKEIYRNLRFSGGDWFAKEERDPDYYYDGDLSQNTPNDKDNKERADLKRIVMATAKRLFPDWFASNSVKLILDLAKED